MRGVRRDAGPQQDSYGVSMPEYLSVVCASASAPHSVDWLGELRNLELTRIGEFLPPSGRVLDFGAGAGHQALRLQELGFEVDAVDLESWAHLEKRVFPVRSYDGGTLPFSDAEFDIVISSNVLEHVDSLHQVLAELARVLKPDGLMLHILPSASWRLWTTLAEFPAAPRNLLRGLLSGPTGRRAQAGMSRLQWTLLQLAWPIRPFLLRPHGTGGSALTELWTFSRSSWVRRFESQRYEVLQVKPLRFWYTGENLLGPRLTVSRRTRLSAWLGSATILYVIRSGSRRAAL
jgi:SAM-dependent methyltransferase